ncbi:MAG: hypothetical protein AUH86_06640 [Acidobacteria bacterium 13_1_40CM_4_58_4]|nr:MAG: hypothetical protein AUH86_06640 [Acidobacteria bacterium 13_1_40CM_4_58_4]
MPTSNCRLPISMADPAVQLQRLYLAGFEMQTFDRFPKCVGVVRDNCIALLVPTPDGLQMLGTPGWRMGEVMGVLVETEGRQVFQAKQEIIEATPERLENLRRFRDELTKLIRCESPSAPSH